MSDLITPPPYFDDVQPVSGGEYPACTARMDQRFDGIVTLQFVRAGTCWFGIDGGPRRLLDRPAMFWHTPEHAYQYWPGPTGTWHHLWSSFSDARVGRLVREGFAAIAPEGHLIVGQRAAFTTLFRRMIKLIRGGAPGDVPTVARTVEEILALAMADRVPRASADPRTRAILAIARTLEQRPFERVDWPTLAGELFISDSHFRRLFRATIGCAPQAFLLRARVRRATAMLADPNVSVKAVALATGYNDPAQFTKLFRSVTGLPPGAYRLIHAHRGDPA